MTENYKKQWEQINCQSCTFSPYGNSTIKLMKKRKKK